jgi:hypothetical protein
MSSWMFVRVCTGPRPVYSLTSWLMPFETATLSAPSGGGGVDIDTAISGRLLEW